MQHSADRKDNVDARPPPPPAPYVDAIRCAWLDTQCAAHVYKSAHVGVFEDVLASHLTDSATVPPANAPNAMFMARVSTLKRRRAAVAGETPIAQRTADGPYERALIGSLTDIAKALGRSRQDVLDDVDVCQWASLRCKQYDGSRYPLARAQYAHMRGDYCKSRMTRLADPGDDKTLALVAVLEPGGDRQDGFAAVSACAWILDRARGHVYELACAPQHAAFSESRLLWTVCQDAGTVQLCSRHGAYHDHGAGLNNVWRSTSQAFDKWLHTQRDMRSDSDWSAKGLRATMTHGWSCVPSDAIVVTPQKAGAAAALDESKATCGVCMEREPSCVLVPCGHTLCPACAPRVLDKCPFCRAGVREHVQIKHMSVDAS
jgi:hypothetical protein